MTENIEQRLSEINILIVKGNYSEAETKAKDALSLFDGVKKESTNFVWMLILLAELSFRHKRYDEALSYAERALSIIQKRFGQNYVHEMASLSFIGLSQLKLKQFSLAKATLTKVLQLTKNSFGKNSENYLLSLQNLALVCNEMGDTVECELGLEESMEVYLELVKDNFDMLDYDERIALSDKYFSYQLCIYNYISNSQHCSDEFLKKVLDFRLNTKMQLLEKLDANIFVGNSFDKIKRSLHADEAAIEVIRFLEMEEMVTGNSRYVFLIVSHETVSSPKLVSIFTDPDEEKNEHDVYLRNIQKKTVDFSSYDTYWKVLEPELKDKKKIYFSPDGIYRYLNVNTLMKEEGIYLLEDCNILLYNDLRNLIDRDQLREKLPTEALLLSSLTFYNDEVFSKDKTIAKFLPQIPESKNEIATVRKILDDSNCHTYVCCDEAVTKSVFNNITEFQLLHIATHGYFRIPLPDTPVKTEEMMSHSGLFLSHPFVYSQEKEDLELTEEGFLSSGNIVEMELHNLDLVVLSACNSGLGFQIQSGDSFGFVRTFFVAGAHNLITSLWEVEDKITHEFMKLFYSSWMEEQNKYSAFNRAQREMKHKYRYPMYWGGFILVHR